jgi:hypothetical protein
VPDNQPPIEQPGVQEPATSSYDQLDEGAGWLDASEEREELPRRPRRRLFTPLSLGLLGALLIAAGFIAGVEVQKGEEPSSASSGATTASLASRFGARRAAGASSSGTSAGKTAAGGLAGGFPGLGAGGARPTTGTVAYLAGNTLYVTNAEGNTVKVDTSAATSVTKTVNAQVNGIHPGEDVTITGTTGTSGAVSAESITVGSSAGGISALFGGSGKSSTSEGAGAQTLFGSG